MRQHTSKLSGRPAAIVVMEGRGFHITVQCLTCQQSPMGHADSKNSTRMYLVDTVGRMGGAARQCRTDKVAPQAGGPGSAAAVVTADIAGSAAGAGRPG